MEGTHPGQQLPELPLARRARFMEEFKIPEYDADILTSERDLADYFEESAHLYAGDAKKISNWLMNDVLRMRNELGKSMQELSLTPAYLVELVHLTDTGKINSTTAKSLLQKIQESGRAPAVLVEELGLAVVSDDGAIRSICRKDHCRASDRSSIVPRWKRIIDRLVCGAGHARNVRQSRCASHATYIKRDT